MVWLPTSTNRQKKSDFAHTDCRQIHTKTIKTQNMRLTIGKILVFSHCILTNMTLYFECLSTSQELYSIFDQISERILVLTTCHRRRIVLTGNIQPKQYFSSSTTALFWWTTIFPVWWHHYFQCSIMSCMMKCGFVAGGRKDRQQFGRVITSNALDCRRRPYVYVV
jgi:hypothetical protein